MPHTLKSASHLDIQNLPPPRGPGSNLLYGDASFRLYFFSHSIALATIEAHLKAQRERKPIDLAGIEVSFDRNGLITAQDSKSGVRIQHCSSPGIKLEAGKKEDEIVITVTFTINCFEGEGGEENRLWDRSVAFSVVHRIDVHDYEQQPSWGLSQPFTEHSFTSNQMDGTSGSYSNPSSGSLVDRLDKIFIRAIDTVAQTLSDLLQAASSGTSYSVVGQDRPTI